MKILGKYPSLRLRRNRKYNWSRRLVAENNLTVNDLILPIFLIEGKNKKIPIKSMPEVYRYTINKLGTILDKAIKKKIPMVALFPYTAKKLKNNFYTFFWRLILIYLLIRLFFLVLITYYISTISSL